MAKLMLSIFILLFLVSISSAGDLQERGPEDYHCIVDRNKADKHSPQDGSDLKGFSVFSTEAPIRKGSEIKKYSNLPEDKEFMDSLRMFLGLGKSAAPDCFRQPSDRGLLRGE
jgi:hypothetical protein